MKSKTILKPQARGYSEAGASLVRRAMKGFKPNSSSPNEDINFNNSTLRQRSRMLYMASPVAASAINTNRTKVIGTGLTLKATLNHDTLGLTGEQAKLWQKHTEEEFSVWADKAENCDALGINNFYELQQLAMKSWLTSGDVFVLVTREQPTSMNPYTLRLHLIEADRICTPIKYRASITAGLNIVEGLIPEGDAGAGHRIYDGVEIDDNGKVVAYHICNIYPNQIRRENMTWTRVLATGNKTGLKNVFHIMEAERPDQYRGVPYLAPVIETLLQHRRYTESELMAALIQSFFTAWIKTNTSSSEFPLNEVGEGNVGDVPALNPQEENITTSENEYEMGPGTVSHLQDGEDIVFGNPNIPTAGFEAFTKAICKEIGAALEIPYDILMKEFNASYSASRAALLEAWEAFKMRRKWFVNDFCQPIYELWLTEAVANGRVSAPNFFSNPIVTKAYCKAMWIGPVQGQLDPQKEVKASVLMAYHGIKTHEQITRELGGGDWDENVEQLAIENDKLSEIQKKLTPLDFESESETEPTEGEEENE